MHIHLDLIGGIAGDMFTASMLDAIPELKIPLFGVLNKLTHQNHIHLQLTSAMDKGISGQRFLVDISQLHDHTDHGHKHHHRSWRSIRTLLLKQLEDEHVRNHALGIFELLATAEAKIHNKSVEDVHFHEVGAWDCIVDIVSAAWLIHHSNVKSWSCSPVPWGGGIVKCAHGVIPVPAPATLLLLKKFSFIDDGIKGERVTPTGAAILAWLNPEPQLSKGMVTAIGYGFGTRELPDRANLLRATLLVSEPCSISNSDSVTTIQCDIDDMTGEQLAIAREKIRAQDGVLEITESIAIGKKNRHIHTLTILTNNQNSSVVINYVFNHTSTIGIRYWQCQRKILARQHSKVAVADSEYDIKTVTRPDGSITSKIESNHLNDPTLNYHSIKTLSRIVEK